MMSKKFFLTIIALFLIGITIFYLFSKTKKQEFKFIEVKRGEIREEISESGILEMGKPINLSFEIGGKIEKIYVSEGEEVEKGRLLAKLEDKEAKELIERTEISLDLAKKIYQKLKTQYQLLEAEDQKKEILENGISLIREPLERMIYTFEDLERLLFEKDLEEKKANIVYYSEYDKKFFDYPELISDKLKMAREDYQKISTSYQKINEKNLKEKEELINSSYRFFSDLTEILKKAKEPIHYLKEIVLNLNLTHEKALLIENHFALLSQLESYFNELSKNLLSIINKLKNYDHQKEILALDLEAQQLQIKEREKQILEAKRNLEKHYLYSPVEGIISKIYIQEGEKVDLVTTNIVLQILPKSPFEIKVDIYEKDIPKINIGTPVEISIPAFEDKTFFGKVSWISKTEKIKEGVVYYEVKIVPDNLPENVFVGMTCDLKIIVKEKKDALILPRETLKKKEGKYLVEVLEGEKKIERKVETGIFGEDFVEILSGLKEGEKVIIP